MARRIRAMLTMLAVTACLAAPMHALAEMRELIAAYTSYRNSCPF